MNDIDQITSSGPDTIEYVIVVYAQGQVTTIIGFADWNCAASNFREACQQNSANWAYMINAQGDGNVLAEFHSGRFSGV